MYCRTEKDCRQEQGTEIAVSKKEGREIFKATPLLTEDANKPPRKRSNSNHSTMSSPSTTTVYSYASHSPRVQIPQSYIIERTRSLPCLIDDSPKVNFYAKRISLDAVVRIKLSISEVVVERGKSDIDVEVWMMKRRIILLTFLIHNQVQDLSH